VAEVVVDVVVPPDPDVDASVGDDPVAEDDASPESVSDGEDPVLLALPLLEDPSPRRVAVLVLRLPVLVCTPNIPLLMLKGAATTKVVPALAKVEVTVSLPLAVGELDVEPISCAFAMAAGDIGTPTRLQPN
jgi:hypothetical protein